MHYQGLTFHTADVDSADGFLNFAGFAALTYDEHSPAYYRSVFQKIDAAINFNGNGTYLGAINLDSYNTTRCQEICDEMDGCAAFNIYLERDPSLHPHHTEGCPDPPSITNIKCSFFDQYVTGDMAVNSGQTRADFEVVITQSSAYNKSPIPSFSGFTPPVALIGKHENVTETVNGKTAYTGIFDEIEGTYDISQCADHCNLITLTNRANPDPDGSYLPCNYFSAHQHTIDEGRYALNCMYFTVPLGREYVNYYGDRRGDSWHGVTDSWGFSTKVQDPGQVTPPP